MELDKALDERHSARNFMETKKPHYGKVIKAIEAAAKAPLAGNLPCLKYIIVTDPKKIDELSQAAQQSFISKVKFVVAVCSDKKFLDKYYLDRSDKYTKQQAGAAIESFLLKITDMGLASCWVGAFSDETVKRILKVPDDIDVEALLPVGYEIEEKTKQAGRIKPNIDSLLFFNTYKNKKMLPERMPEYQ
jgi:nitroreductase